MNLRSKKIIAIACIMLTCTPTFADSHRDDDLKLKSLKDANADPDVTKMSDAELDNEITRLQSHPSADVESADEQKKAIFQEEFKAFIKHIRQVNPELRDDEPIIARIAAKKIKTEGKDYKTAIIEAISEFKQFSSSNQHVTAAQGFMNSVGGFLGNTAKVGLVMGGAYLRSRGSHASNGNYVQPTYSAAPAQEDYAPAYSPASSYGSGNGSNPVYLGRLSANPYAADSTSNQFGQYGSPYSSTSINNTYSQPGMAVASQYSSGGPQLYGSNGQFLGNLNSNRYDSNSVSNPYGPYGSKYSSTSINNQYGQYGSPYSNQSANNQYGSDAPIIIGDNN